jgi:hypothetical protein
MCFPATWVVASKPLEIIMHAQFIAFLESIHGHDPVLVQSVLEAYTMVNHIDVATDRNHPEQELTDVRAKIEEALDRITRELSQPEPLPNILPPDQMKIKRKLEMTRKILADILKKTNVADPNADIVAMLQDVYASLDAVGFTVGFSGTSKFESVVLESLNQLLQSINESIV